MPEDELSKLNAAAKQAEKKPSHSPAKRKARPRNPKKRTRRPTAEPPRKSVNGLGIASLVIGIVAVLFCWIPFVHVFALYPAVFALIFGIIGLIISVVGRKSGAGMPLAGIIVAATALVFASFVHESIFGEPVAETTNESKTTSNDESATAGPRQPTEAQAPAKPPGPSPEESVIQVRYLSQEKARFGTSLSFRLTNTSGKPIKAVKGGIHIYDQFGDKLDGLGVKLDKPLDAGESVTEEGVWPVGSRCLDLLKNNLSDLRLVFRAENVIYAE